MKRKIVALSLTAAMTVGLLAGCGASDSADKSASSGSTTSTETISGDITYPETRLTLSTQTREDEEISGKYSYSMLFPVFLYHSFLRVRRKFPECFRSKRKSCCSNHFVFMDWKDCNAFPDRNVDNWNFIYFRSTVEYRYSKSDV